MTYFPLEGEETVGRRDVGGEGREVRFETVVDGERKRLIQSLGVARGVTVVEDDYSEVVSVSS